MAARSLSCSFSAFIDLLMTSSATFSREAGGSLAGSISPRSTTFSPRTTYNPSGTCRRGRDYTIPSIILYITTSSGNVADPRIAKAYPAKIAALIPACHRKLHIDHERTLTSAYWWPTMIRSTVSSITKLAN